MPTSLLCVTVAAGTMDELRQQRDRVAGADLVELRLDHVDRPDVAGALAGRRTPVIVTCRSQREGGRYSGSESERKALLASALQLGAEYVDLEFSAAFDDLIHAHHGKRIVLSMHDFDGVPADLTERVRAMRRVGAEVVKVAVHARTLSDSLALLKLKDPATRSVFIGMGPCGLPSRVLAAHFGSAWSYAGDGHAPGQMPIRQMIDDFGFRRINQDTAVYGLAGWPLEHSISPVMHNAALAEARLNAVYVPMAATTADDFLRFAEALNVRGASVTIPYKVDMFSRADEVDELSGRVGAVNTLKRDGSKWLARNSDVGGFLSPLRNRFDLRGARAAIVGAGGAARAVAVALASAGAAVTVYARNTSRAEEVARIVGGAGLALPVPPRSWDLLVNATPVGLTPNVDDTPHAGPFDGRLAYDLIYNPQDTRFLKDAHAAGCDTVGGLEMLVAQAEDQFEWWTSRRPASGLMREAARARLRLDSPHEVASAKSS